MKLSDAQQALLESIGLPGERRGPVLMLDSGHALRTLASLRRLHLVADASAGPIRLTDAGCTELRDQRARRP